ncbi:hypothetical protein [Moorella sp. E308F]|uniref:hypothetical protein n=1 Tax=Moorella sp. E308F TaxID=2572682 RepID=UPI00114302F8|nr:hypothetical protein [Moorella sp. E308F]
MMGSGMHQKAGEARFFMLAAGVLLLALSYAGYAYAIGVSSFMFGFFSLGFTLFVSGAYQMMCRLADLEAFAWAALAFLALPLALLWLWPLGFLLKATWTVFHLASVWMFFIFPQL